MNVEPVTLADLGNFLQNVSNAYDSYLFFALTTMIAFSVAFGVRRLLVGSRS